MDSSRRAVESYWRSRMVDVATSDEDKVAPVYKLEEICELLRSSSISVVKEVTEFVLKRLEHKSPIVKQKALRLIKYAVGKSGVEFKREMQRHAVNVRNLIHYKGTLDPLKVDALNKSVRDTAQETITSIFAEEQNRGSSLSEDLKKRIHGFGSTSSSLDYEEKKSFLSEMVGLGSASIKQGLSSFAHIHPSLKNEEDTAGGYKNPNLRRSLTTGEDGFRFSQQKNGGISMSSVEREATAGSRTPVSKSKEERLVEKIVTSGGIRLQPTRDVLQAFLEEAAKSNAISLSRALNSKLQSHQWQVRLRAVCVLEAIVCQKEREELLPVVLYFKENRDYLMSCAESPQSSLRVKADKVLRILSDERENEERETKTLPELPDLIDTTVDAPNTKDDSVVTTSAEPSLIFDLLTDNASGGEAGHGDHDDEGDPFADVSFHVSEARNNVDDLFTTLTVNQNTDEFHATFPSTSSSSSSSSSVVQQQQEQMFCYVHPHGSIGSPLPDIFYSNSPTGIAAVSRVAATKEDKTDVFGFISDHLSMARDRKRSTG